MLVVSESQVRAHLNPEAAFAAVKAAFVALTKDQACGFPVVREVLPAASATFGIKSGFCPTRGWLGLKTGGYWSANAAVGRENHQSTVLLLDTDSGLPRAVVAGNHLTAVRTAAASAVSVSMLARTDACTLGLVGTGTQAMHQLRAVARLRPIRRVLVWNRRLARAIAFRAAAAQETGLAVELAESPRAVAEASDIVLTLTASTQPLLRREWIRPGTHIAAMGADTRGKRELDADVLLSAQIYTDDRRQACDIGECQYLEAGEREGLIAGTLGQVICGNVPGRVDDIQVTVFDGTGVAMQDLACAAHVVEVLEQGGGRAP